MEYIFIPLPVLRQKKPSPCHFLPFPVIQLGVGVGLEGCAGGNRAAFWVFPGSSLRSWAGLWRLVGIKLSELCPRLREGDVIYVVRGFP